MPQPPFNNADWLGSEIRAWEERRNKQQVKNPLSFNIAAARHKLKKLYPVIAPLLIHMKRNLSIEDCQTLRCGKVDRGTCYMSQNQAV